MLFRSVLSAFGMLIAPRARQLSHSLTALLDAVAATQIDTTLEQLMRQGQRALQQEGVSEQEIMAHASVDLRYQGQSYFLNVPWQDKSSAGELFQQRHQQLYGHRLDLPLELVNVRMAVKARPNHISLFTTQTPATSADCKPVSLYGIHEPVPIIGRDALSMGEKITGPILITETVSTTYLAAGWTCTLSPERTLLLEKTVD